MPAATKRCAAAPSSHLRRSEEVRAREGDDDDCTVVLVPRTLLGASLLCHTGRNPIEARGGANGGGCSLYFETVHVACQLSSRFLISPPVRLYFASFACVTLYYCCVRRWSSVRLPDLFDGVPRLSSWRLPFEHAVMRAGTSEKKSAAEGLEEPNLDQRGGGYESVRVAREPPLEDVVYNSGSFCYRCNFRSKCAARCFDVKLRVCNG